jgi:hypothetical protein
VTVENVVDRDRIDLDRGGSEIEDRDPVLAAAPAPEPDDETRGLGHDRRDVAAVVVLATAAAGHLLEMTDQLVDPAHREAFWRFTLFACFASAVRVRFGRCAIVRLRFAAAAALRMFRRAALVRVAMPQQIRTSRAYVLAPFLLPKRAGKSSSGPSGGKGP